MTKNPIILCEPQCRGFEHAPFNGALLYTVRLAYPKVPVVFMGESEHLRRVQRTLSNEIREHEHHTIWREICVPPRKTEGWKRFQHEWQWCRHVLDTARANNSRFLVLCSITNTGLLALKLLLHRYKTRRRVLAVPHSILNSITAQPKTPWNRLINLRQVLMFPHPEALHYIALGASIHRCLSRIQPRAAVHFSTLDHPYFWVQDPSVGETTPEQETRFGYFGVANPNKGFDKFYRLARDVKGRSEKAEFTLVGFLEDAGSFSKYEKEIDGVTCIPLSPEEYSRRARSITYAVGTGKPEYYRLVANASFLDALAYVKPGIFLRNPYIEHYFDRMGDIGYLCDGYEEMRSIVVSILEEFPRVRYLQQCENIRLGRRLFEPETLAPRLRTIMET